MNSFANTSVSISGTKLQVAQLQCAGLEPAAIAAKLDISVGYISQLQEDTSFNKALGELQSASAVQQHSKYRQIDDNYNEMEVRLTDFIVDKIDVILPQIAGKASTLNSFMRTLNSAKRRSVGEVSPAETTGAVVLELPAFITADATPVVRHNEQNEVVAVGTQELVSMPGEKLAEVSRVASQALPSPDSINELEVLDDEDFKLPPVEVTSHDNITSQQSESTQA